MEMVVGSKEVKDLKHHGAGWAISVNIKSTERMEPCPAPQMVAASSVIPQHCACSIL